MENYTCTTDLVPKAGTLHLDCLQKLLCILKLIYLKLTFECRPTPPRQLDGIKIII